MALLHIPMDRGLDQSKDAAGGSDFTGLRTCRNLWHRTVGILSTRPGTERTGGDIPGMEGLPIAAVEGGLALGGGNVIAQTQTPTGEAAGWATVGTYAQATPLGARDVGARIDVTSDDQIARHATVWKSALLVATLSGSDILVTVYHRETGATLREATFSGGSVTGAIIGWADHGDTSPTLFIRGSTAGTTLRKVRFDDQDNYATLTLTMNDGVDERAIVCGHAGGAAHVAFASGPIRYYSSIGMTTGDQINSGMSMPAISTCFSYAGRAWFAGVAFSTLYVLVATAGTSDGIDTAAPADSSKVKPVIVATGTDSAAVFVNAPGTNGSVSRFSVTAVTAPNIGTEDATYLRQATVLGGALFDGTLPYVWALIGNAASGSGGTPNLSASVVLISVPVSSSDFARKTVLAHDAFMSASNSAAGLRWPASGYAPADAPFPEAWVTGGLYDLLDVTDTTLAQCMATVFTFEQPRRLSQFLGRQLVPGGALCDMFGTCGHTMPQTFPVITGNGSTSGSLSAGVYQFTAVHYRRDHDGTVRRGAPSQISERTATAGTGITLTIGYDETLPEGWEIAIYRTKANGTLFFLDGFTTPGATYTSSQNDTNLSNNEVLYTEGGVLFNDSAPSHRFLTVGKNRAWLGGLAQKFRVRFSKEGVRGETPAFPDDASHWLDLSQDVTALAAIDDVVLAFHKSSIDLISGDGPDARGTGAFQVRPVSVNTGADDWRSVVVTPVGVFFAGSQTIWMLGRGMGAPENIGALVSDLLDEYPEIVSAQFVEYAQHQCVQFLCSNGTATTRLVFSLRTLQWYQWDGLEAQSLGSIVIDGQLRTVLLGATFVSADGQLLTESAELTADDGEQVTTAIRTHHIHPWGIAADAMVDQMWVRAKVSEAQSWTLAMEENGGETSEVQGPIVRPVAVGWKNYEYRPRNAKLQSIALELTAGPVAIAGMTIDQRADGKPREATTRRTG